MKNSIYLLGIIASTLISCSNDAEQKSAEHTQEKIDSLTSVEAVTQVEAESPNMTVEHPLGSVEGLGYKEYYDDGALKIVGDLDDEGERNGLWVSYYETGIKWSESYYINGLKSGHSITFFPNGKVRYVGEYLDDKKTGTWTFYDEEGNEVQQETY